MPEINIWLIENELIDDHAWLTYVKDNMAHTAENIHRHILLRGELEGLERAWDIIQKHKDVV